MTAVKRNHHGASTFVLVVLGAVVSGAVVWLLADADPGEMIAVGLAFAALIYALRQFTDAGATLDGIEETNESLDKLADRLDHSVGTLQTTFDNSVKGLEGQLSTRQIGRFPEFMSDIIDLLDEAEDEIVICCDHPAYGVFSAFEEYDDYAETVRRKVAQGIPTSLLHNDTLRRAQLRKIQLRNGGDWKAWRQKKNMRDFLAKYGDTEQRWSERLWILRITEEEFLEVLAKIDEEALRDVFGEVSPEHKITTHDVLPLYFWMASGKRGPKAVFALAPLTAGAPEVGFRTEDAGLVRALRGIFERYAEVHRDNDDPGHREGDPDLPGPASAAEIVEQTDK